MYAPNFSEVASVSVHRLAWAIGATMGQVVDVMVKALPAFINAEKVCLACKDNTRCHDIIMRHYQ